MRSVAPQIGEVQCRSRLPLIACEICRRACKSGRFRDGAEAWLYSMAFARVVPILDGCASTSPPLFVGLRGRRGRLNSDAGDRADLTQGRRWTISSDRPWSIGPLEAGPG